MIGYTLKYITFDHMILDLPYPTYQIYEYANTCEDDEYSDEEWTGFQV